MCSHYLKVPLTFTRTINGVELFNWNKNPLTAYVCMFNTWGKEPIVYFQMLWVKMRGCVNGCWPGAALLEPAAEERATAELHIHLSISVPAFTCGAGFVQWLTEWGCSHTLHDKGHRSMVSIEKKKSMWAGHLGGCCYSRCFPVEVLSAWLMISS